MNLLDPFGVPLDTAVRTTEPMLVLCWVRNHKTGNLYTQLVPWVIADSLKLERVKV